jgi:RNA polymerase sigma factor (sigma-70 family)
MHTSHHITQQLAAERSKDLRRDSVRRTPSRGPAVETVAPASPQATGHVATAAADSASAPSSPSAIASAPRRHDSRDLDALVSAAAAGDDAAWDVLVGTFRSTIAAVTRMYRLCAADASDVAQMTWIRLYEHIHRINDPSRLGAWLATTARRECLRVARANDRHVPYGDDTPDGESPDVVPEEALFIAERDAALWHSFKRLDERDRALLGLLVTSPKPAYGEISTALEMPRGSIGPTRQRALQRLHHQLEVAGDLALMRS